MAPEIVSLNTGHAILFSPNGLCVKSSDEKHESRVSPLGQGYLTVRSRLRVTRDAGPSLLAVQDTQLSTRLGRVRGGAATPQITRPCDSASTQVMHAPPQVYSSHDGTRGERGQATPLSPPVSVEAGIFSPTTITPTSAPAATVPPAPAVLLLAVQDTQHSTRLGRVQGGAAAAQSPQQSLDEPILRDVAPAQVIQAKSQVYSSDGGAIGARGQATVTPPLAGIQAAISSPTTTTPTPVPAAVAQETNAMPAAAVTPRVPQETPAGRVTARQPSALPTGARPRAEDDDSDPDDDIAPLFGSSSSSVAPSSSNTPEPQFEAIVHTLALLHSNGYPRVSQSYVAKQLGSRKRYQAELVAATFAGQVVFHPGASGPFLWLPADSPFRRPVHVTRPAGASEFAPLLQRLNGVGPVTRKTLRKYFKSGVPDAPYGQTGFKIDKAITRACQAKIVKFGGEGQRAWVSKKS
jgi:hypothetical protein